MEAEIRHLASYLCVSCGKINTDKELQVPVLQDDSGRVVKGLASISKYLAKKSNLADILGRSPEDMAIVNQWLEYRVTQVDRITQERDQQQILKELNTYLSDRVYLVGFYVTLADLILYLGLYTVFSELTFYDKQQYLHLSRWFDQVQHTSGVQQNLKKIYFQKNLIYGKGSH